MLEEEEEGSIVGRKEGGERGRKDGRRKGRKKKEKRKEREKFLFTCSIHQSPSLLFPALSLVLVL